MTESQLDYLLMLPRFAYLAPKTINEACLSLSAYEGDAKIMAGGTDLLVSMKQKKITPAYIVNIKGIPKLDCVSSDHRFKIQKFGPVDSFNGLVAKIANFTYC